MAYKKEVANNNSDRQKHIWDSISLLVLENYIKIYIYIFFFLAIDIVIVISRKTVKIRNRQPRGRQIEM